MFIKVLQDPEIRDELRKLDVSRELMKKELEDAEMTVKWALGNLKKLGDKVDDPKYAAVARDVSIMVLKWNEVIGADELVVPPNKRLPEPKAEDVEDAEFKEDDDAMPTKID